MMQKLRFFPVMMVAAVMLALAPASGADAGKFTLPPYTTVKLDNGMTLLLLERHQLPLISFNWLLKSGGSICDSPGSEGVAFVTTQLLRQGTKTRTAEQIAEQLDFVGGSVSADASYDYASGSGEFMSKDAALGIEMLADLLRNPVFPKEEMTTLIKQQVDEIVTASEASIVAAMRMIWERMKIVIEPSSALPLAVILENREKFAGKKIGIILSGGNVELS
ncbi:MAG: pyridoxal-phosphate dependent enzyme, partial [Verrucomicrobiota bacterium]